MTLTAHQPESSERRRFPRLNYFESVRFRDVFNPHSFCGSLARDLSVGGVRVTTEEFLPKDHRVVLLLQLPGVQETIRAISRVAWVRKEQASERFECGLEFIGISPRDQGLLAAHVERGVVPVVS